MHQPQPLSQPQVQVSAKPEIRSEKEGGDNKPSASFNLKKAFAESTKVYENKKTESAEEQVKLTGRDLFDVEKVEAVFKEYIKLHNPERTVVVALKAHKPVIDGDEIILKIDNKLQQEKLEAIRIGLLNALMKKLNNGGIRFTVQFFVEGESREKKTFITAQDKLEHFIKLNPVVGELKTAFGLELE